MTLSRSRDRYRWRCQTYIIPSRAVEFHIRDILVRASFNAGIVFIWNPPDADGRQVLGSEHIKYYMLYALGG